MWLATTRLAAPTSGQHITDGRLCRSLTRFSPARHAWCLMRYFLNIWSVTAKGFGVSSNETIGTVRPDVPVYWQDSGVCHTADDETVISLRRRVTEMVVSKNHGKRNTRVDRRCTGKVAATARDDDSLQGKFWQSKGSDNFVPQNETVPYEGTVVAVCRRSRVGAVTSGVAAVTSGVGAVTSGVAAITSGVAAVTSVVGAVTSGVGAVTSGVGAVTSGVGAVTSGVAAVTSGVAAVTSGVGAVTSGVGAVTSGVAAVTSGVGAVTSGVAAVTSGVAAVTSALRPLVPAEVERRRQTP
ncbi:hypothetical protein LSAT2_006521 [Lamellibrachia satsuma]|nr:hypothetical protein LSAT2_006521 [Lamellibrachia satsuma]